MSTDPEEGRRPRSGGRNTISLRAALIGAVLLAIFTSVGTYAALHVLTPLYPERVGAEAALSQAENWERFLDVISFVHEHYVDPDTAEMERLLEGAMKGIISSLDDPYSAYFDRTRVEDFQRTTRGTYEGIGVQVVSRTVDDTSYTIVVVAFDGSPAAAALFDNGTSEDPAGLQPGDRILSVDGEEVVDVSLDVVAELIRGPAGSSVTLEVQRDDRDELLVFHVERAGIVVPTASSQVLPDGVGYLRIMLFNEQTPAQVRHEIQRLQAASIEALVIDLRNNPGGRLDETIEVANLLLPEGPVVHIRDRGQQDVTFESQGPGVNLPMAVLINGSSASAAEILAAAVRDRVDGPLVGQATFGKNSVQTFYQLEQGLRDTAGIKVTVARFFTPDGTPLTDDGLEPDILVEVPAATTFGDLDDDEALQAAAAFLVQQRAGAVAQGAQ